MKTCGTCALFRQPVCPWADMPRQPNTEACGNWYGDNLQAGTRTGACEVCQEKAVLALDAARGEIARLREALRPFAVVPESCSRCGDSWVPEDDNPAGVCELINQPEADPVVALDSKPPSWCPRRKAAVTLAANKAMEGEANE